MTAPFLGFTKSPRYKQRLQRLNAMNPNQRATLNSLLLDEDEAEREMKKHINLAHLGNEKKRTTGILRLGEKRLTHDIDLAGKRLALGGERIKTRADISRQNMKTRERVAGIQGDSAMDRWQRGFDYNRSQLPLANTLETGNLALQGYLGYKGMQEDRKVAEDIRKLAGLYGGR